MKKMIFATLTMVLASAAYADNSYTCPGFSLSLDPAGKADSGAYTGTTERDQDLDMAAIENLVYKGDTAGGANIFAVQGPSFTGVLVIPAEASSQNPPAEIKVLKHGKAVSCSLDSQH